MRIGSKVAISRIKENGESYVLPKETAGTIIAVKYEHDGDGYQGIDWVSVRWTDGRVRTIVHTLVQKKEASGMTSTHHTTKATGTVNQRLQPTDTFLLWKKQKRQGTL